MWALAKHEKYHGIRRKFDPFNRDAAMPEVIRCIALEPSPVRANKQPCSIIPAAVQYEPSISSAIVIRCAIWVAATV